MNALAVMIRRQRLQVAASKQRLQESRAQKEKLAAALAEQRAQSEALQQRLWSQLNQGEELALTALGLTQAALRAALDTGARLDAELQNAEIKLTEAERDAARAQKRLEKLEELALRHRREIELERQRLEGLALDEWVICAGSRP